MLSYPTRNLFLIELINGKIGILFEQREDGQQPASAFHGQPGLPQVRAHRQNPGIPFRIPKQKRFPTSQYAELKWF
jgi:hypothetical protein